jgi:hypothetical protein
MHGAAKTALLVTAAFLGSFSATWVAEFSGLGERVRRLADVYVAAATMSTGIGCLAISDTGTASKDLSSGTCAGSTYCPDCFYFTGSGALTMTFSNCHTSKWGSSLALGSGDVATAVRQFTFVNTMTGNAVTVTDGTNSYVIPAKGSAIAYCFTGTSNTFYFPYNPSSNGCPSACDATTPNDISGSAFSNVVHPAVSIGCTTSITYANDDTDGGTGGTTTTANICVTR